MVLLSGFVFSISSVDKTKQLNIFIFVNLLFHYLKLVFWKDCVPLNTLTRNVQNTQLTNIIDFMQLCSSFVLLSPQGLALSLEILTDL